MLKTFVGPDAKTSEHYARIVSTQHCERLKGLLADPKSGTAVVGGGVDVANRYVEPTILKDVKYDSKVRHGSRHRRRAPDFDPLPNLYTTPN